MGARFTTRAVGLPLTLRLNVNNVANKSHWMNSCYVGAPRGVAFSAQLQF
jgi:iron complex outermembrane receptor protein